MKKLTAAAVLLLLAGCASIPQPKPTIAPKKKPAVVKVAPVEQPTPEATTPNQVVKKRWYDRFLKHKSAQ